MTSSGRLDELFHPPLHTCLPTVKALPDSSFLPLSRRYRSGKLLTEAESVMGEVILPRRMFLWCMAVIYMTAFVSLYVQIPGEVKNNAAARALQVSLLAWLLPLPRGTPGSFCLATLEN